MINRDNPFDAIDIRYEVVPHRLDKGRHDWVLARKVWNLLDLRRGATHRADNDSSWGRQKRFIWLVYNKSMAQNARAQVTSARHFRD